MYLWLNLQRLQPPCSTENVETGQVYSSTLTGTGNCGCCRRSHMIWSLKFERVRERRGALACRSLMMVSLYRCLPNCFKWTLCHGKKKSYKCETTWWQDFLVNCPFKSLLKYRRMLKVNVKCCSQPFLLPQCDVWGRNWMELKQNRASKNKISIDYLCICSEMELLKGRIYQAEASL